MGLRQKIGGTLAKKLKNEKIVNTSIFILGNIISQALAFFVLPVLTRFLPPEEYGIFNYTTSIQSFLLVISTLSLNSFVLRHYFELTDERERRRMFGTVALFVLVFNFLLLCAEFVLFPILITKYNVQVPFDPYFKLALVTSFLESLSLVPLAYLRVHKKAWSYFSLTTLSAISAIFLGLFLIVVHHQGVLGRYHGILYVDLLFASIYLFMIFKVAGFHFDFSILKQGLKFSLPILPAAFSSMAILALDRILLERYASISMLGIYSVGVALGTVILIIVRGFYYAIEPEIYSYFKRDDFNKKIITMKNNFLVVILLVGAMVIIFSKEIVIIMASSQYLASYTIVPFIVVASIFRGLEMIATTTLYAFKKTMYHPMIVGAALVINFVSNIILIPKMGITGAALAALLSFWFIYISATLITKYLGGIRWGIVADNMKVLGTLLLSLLIGHIETSTLTITILLKIVASVVLVLLGAQYYFWKNPQKNIQANA